MVFPCRYSIFRSFAARGAVQLLRRGLSRGGYDFTACLDPINQKGQPVPSLGRFLRICCAVSDLQLCSINFWGLRCRACSTDRRRMPRGRQDENYGDNRCNDQPERVAQVRLLLQIDATANYDVNTLFPEY